MDPWFTPRSAIARLGDWKGPLLRIQAIFRFLERHGPTDPVQEGPVSPDYFDMLRRYRRAQRSLEGHGLMVCDPAQARVRIPSRRAGRPVWICWSPDEAAPRFWHESHESWGSRQPIDGEGPWDRPETAASPGPAHLGRQLYSRP